MPFNVLDEGPDAEPLLEDGDTNDQQQDVSVVFIVIIIDVFRITPTPGLARTGKSLQ